MNPPTMTSTVGGHAGVLAETGTPPSASATADASGEIRTVVTRMTFPVPAAQVWGALMLYEQVDARPPLFLRLLLPIPIRAEGGTPAVGDEVRCLYEGGHLVKRVVGLDEARLYAFEVIEQALAVGGGLRLHGGWYGLRELPDGRTEVEAGTRYASPRRPRWIFRRVEAAICHRFHRYLLGAIGRCVQPGGARPVAA